MPVCRSYWTHLILLSTTSDLEQPPERSNSYIRIPSSCALTATYTLSPMCKKKTLVGTQGYTVQCVHILIVVTVMTLYTTKYDTFTIKSWCICSMYNHAALIIFIQIHAVLWQCTTRVQKYRIAVIIFEIQKCFVRRLITWSSVRMSYHHTYQYHR